MLSKRLWFYLGLIAIIVAIIINLIKPQRLKDNVLMCIGIISCLIIYLRRK